jgi:hypothetical protein
MADENVRFEVELLDSSSLPDAVKVMLIRECTNFVTTFAGEWMKNITIIEDNGFKVNDDGHLICGREHFKDGSEDLGPFVLFENLMAVGQAIMSHNINVTHKDEQEVPHRVPPAVNRGAFRNGSTCDVNCPTHAHTHYRKVIGD